MKRIDYIIKVVSAMLLAGILPSSCTNGETDQELQPEEPTVSITTQAIDGSRAAEEGRDNTFKVLFWLETVHLKPSTTFGRADWPDPYLTGHAPQPVAFYKNSVFDTRYPYPAPENRYLYATGFAPGNLLKPDKKKGYKILTAEISDTEKSRYDFLGCDFWEEVFRGSLKDPFAKDKNKLYFRHLSAKLVFYADREKESMENKQYVRNVQVRHLQMSIDGGKTWTPMYTPSVFEWKDLTDDDFTRSYNRTIEAVRDMEGNKEAATGTRPTAGYKAVEAEQFAGELSDYVLQRGNMDRVQIRGTNIDSCYVCNPIKEDGTPAKGKPIQLKMDISAEMSFDPNFPMKDDDSTTDDLTFTRVWRGVVLDAIDRVKVENGTVQTLDEVVYEFKPGCLYRINIHFNRTGVNLAAKELDWGFGGVHYITIQGGDKKTTTTQTKE